MKIFYNNLRKKMKKSVKFWGIFEKMLKMQRKILEEILIKVKVNFDGIRWGFRKNFENFVIFKKVLNRE